MTHPYTLIRSHRYSVSLQIKSGGELVVRAPHLYPTYLINRFVESKDSWINKRLLELNKPHPPIAPFITEESLRKLVTEYVERYSERMSLAPSRIRFTNVRTYWGSCSPKGVISFNLRLVYTSQAAVEYVVVHELAHLRWRGHGVRFWDLVKKHFPQTNEIRKLLRQFPRDYTAS